MDLGTYASDICDMKLEEKLCLYICYFINLVMRIVTWMRKGNL